MDADADLEWPARLRVDALHRGQHLAARGDCAMRGVGGLERRTEQGEKAIAQKLVHDATLAVIISD